MNYFFCFVFSGHDARHSDTFERGSNFVNVHFFFTLLLRFFSRGSNKAERVSQMGFHRNSLGTSDVCCEKQD